MQLQLKRPKSAHFSLKLLAATSLLIASSSVTVKAQVVNPKSASKSSSTITEVKQIEAKVANPTATNQAADGPTVADQIAPNPKTKAQALTPSIAQPESVPTMVSQSSTGESINIVAPTSSTVTTTEVGAEVECDCQLKLKVSSPSDDAVLDAPAGIIIMQYKQGKTVELRVNGELVNANQIGKTETDSQRKRVTQTWYGVPLKPGMNTLTATAADGETDTITVEVRDTPKQLSLATVQSRVPADGQSIVDIKGQVLDAQGNLAKDELIVTLASNGGEFVGDDADKLLNGFQTVAKDGQFTAQLRTDVAPKEVQIRAAANGMEAFTRVAFETNLRPSIATGSINLRLGGRGNDYYGSLRDFLPANNDNGFTADLSARVFAMGRVGDWLMTGALNSNDNLNKSCDDTNRLFRTEEPCDTEYPTYGDASESTILTPSIDSVYFKLEKNASFAPGLRDYVMWGDYRTKEFATKSQQFTAMTRELHGFKGNYYFGPLQVSALFANNIQGFQRDTLVPDGTSGFYFLSQRQLIEGSESVFLEVEELNRPGTVIERVQLFRGPDYTVDYDRGTLRFDKPVLRTDVSRTGEPLVRRIVSTYQFENDGSSNRLYGGRARYHFSKVRDREAWIGATYMRENQGARNFELYGADAYLGLGENASIIAEFAKSNNDSEFRGGIGGNAVRIEAGGQLTPNLDARAYYRQADSGFANNATVSFVPGQTRYGAQASAKVGDQTTLRAQVDHELNRGIAPQPINNLVDLFNPGQEATPGTAVDNSLTTLSAGILQKIGNADLSLDWFYRNREDRLTPGVLDGSSNQLRSRLNVPLNSRVDLIAQNETTLSGNTDPIYNDRTLLGLDWRVMDGVNLQVAQQFFHRGQFAGRQITSVNVTGDYNLTPSTMLRSRYTLFGGADDMTMQGAIGVQQDIKLSDNFKFDLGYERVFGNLFGSTATGTQFLQPFAVGQSASALGVAAGDVYRIGMNYVDGDRFQAAARYERRNSSLGNNQVISANAKGKINKSVSALVKFAQANAANQTINGLQDTMTVKAGLAYRNPENDKFTALMRYEYRRNPGSIPDSIFLGNGTGYHQHLVGMEALYVPNWRWEFFGRLALRSSTSYLASDLVGTSTVTLAQARASYRFADAWDITGEARWLNQSSASYGETGFSAELGYYITPNLRVAGGYSFGRAVDRNFSDGDRSVGGAYLNVSVKLNDLFQGFGQQDWPQPAAAPIPTAASEQPPATGNLPPANSSTETAPANPETGLTPPNNGSTAEPATGVPPIDPTGQPDRDSKSIELNPRRLPQLQQQPLGKPSTAIPAIKQGTEVAPAQTPSKQQVQSQQIESQSPPEEQQQTPVTLPQLW
ncbi:TonB-dependent receptor [filamentous cyanobacterium LEGE 11480]|uniref:TonB-dependent receptor n=1 Tax=Romeriopsis navalis LEGE 11480 TaxID=2777977 RepID=A0A928Z682_9CYAN|nr:TonB-dependent receptor [Romeriopsis navalis]MBE9032343.1 TonB-dependent receptor [Romeriopsis navalis LEGE 11480]